MNYKELRDENERLSNELNVAVRRMRESHEREQSYIDKDIYIVYHSTVGTGEILGVYVVTCKHYPSLEDVINHLDIDFNEITEIIDIDYIDNPVPIN